MYQKTKDKIYCSKHKLEYTKENVKKAMEMELRFGCFIKVKKSRAKYADMHNCSINEPVEVCSTGGYCDDWRLLSYVDGFGDICSLEKGYKILGTPITLEDVLRATGYKLNKECRDTYYFDGNNFHISNKVWQLGKTFDDQSTVTKDFIKDLLK